MLSRHLTTTITTIRVRLASSFATAPHSSSVNYPEYYLPSHNPAFQPPALQSRNIRYHKTVTTPFRHRHSTNMSSSDEKSRDESPISQVPIAPENISIAKYAGTRFSTLKPPMAKAPNPIRLLAMLNTQQWLFFFVGFFAWTWDAFDFFTVSLTVSDLAKTFDKSTTQITWGITLVLMFRSVGSIIFGKARSMTSIPPRWTDHLIRYRRRQIWEKMAVRRQQSSIHRPRIRHRLLSDIQGIFSRASSLWSCHGRSLW